MPEKILFFGLGSIGKRHLKLIQKNYNFDIYAYRTNKEEKIPNIVNIYDINEAINISPDIVFITNPTYLHIETALLCLESNIKNFFIEKPLSHSLKDLDLFYNKVRKSNAIVYVGYVMRHNPIIKRLKSIVNEKRENIFYAQTICSSFLPNWRSDRDYRKVYSAKKELGGGVILELIHEFDYNEYLFGKIQSIEGIYGKISDLDIDSEDYCDVSVKFENNMNGTIHLDYFSYNQQRQIKIVTHEEEIIGDLINNKIFIINNEKTAVENFKFERDDYFEEQLNFFFNGIEKKSTSIDNLKEAKDLLVKILEFKSKKN